ncbi:MAG: hypothetical protein HQK50_13525 [Oligoflexia bacterium]|nr:hypothetical protein [Oligoflexia bacterium]
MRDNWCVGYSDRYTVAVWVGNLDGGPMWSVSGVMGAAPVYQELMDALHTNNDRYRPTPPKAVVKKGSDYYLAGTLPGEKLQDLYWKKRIAYPTEGMIVALDPDIPTENQKILIRVEADVSAALALVLTLNDRPLPLDKSSLTSMWRPTTRGKYNLRLKASVGGETFDTISFEVR